MPRERKELEQHHARIVAAESGKQLLPAAVEIGGGGTLATGPGERARRVVRRHEGRELDHLRAAQVESRHGPAALDEDDRLAGAAERPGEPGRSLEVAKAE